MKLWRVDDVMTKDVVAVRPGTGYQDLVTLLIERRVSAVPVVDRFGYVLGVVSEADLLLKMATQDDEDARILSSRRRRLERTKAKGIRARDLMTTPAVTVIGSISVAAAAQRMRAANVKRLPVEDDLGRLVGIVTRSDLLKAQMRSDVEIQRDVTDEVLWQDLALEPEKVRATTAHGLVTLTGRTRCRSTAERAVRLARRVPGVVDVVDVLTFEIDDLAVLRIKHATPVGVT